MNAESCWAARFFVFFFFFSSFHIFLFSFFRPRSWGTVGEALGDNILPGMARTHIGILLLVHTYPVFYDMFSDYEAMSLEKQLSDQTLVRIRTTALFLLLSVM